MPVNVEGVRDRDSAAFQATLESVAEAPASRIALTLSRDPKVKELIGEWFHQRTHRHYQKRVEPVNTFFQKKEGVPNLLDIQQVFPCWYVPKAIAPK